MHHIDNPSILLGIDFIPMVNSSHNSAGSHRAEPFQSIQFSGEPETELLSPYESRIQAVRYAGTRGADLARANGLLAHNDTFMVNLSASARHRGRIGDIRFDRPLQRGQVSFIPHNHYIDLEFPSDFRSLMLFIPSVDLQRVIAELGVHQLQPIISERNDRLSQLAAMVAAELRAPGFASDLMTDGLIRAIGAALVQRESTPHDHVGGRIHLSPVRLAKVMDYIESTLDREIHLTDLATIAGLSPFHFSRVFKLETGETPYHFVGMRRLERARLMLLSSDMPLAELALSCGFASQSHFTAAFSKAMGVSPGRYRRMRGR